MFKTMLKLKTELDMDGVVIRYKDFVLSAEFVVSATDAYWKVDAWRPIETEEETGIEFHNLRLENITEWDGQRFDTEGEAIFAGIQFLEWRY